MKKSKKKTTKNLKDIKTVCPWCGMGLERDDIGKLVEQASKEVRQKLFVHEDWARDKGSQR